MSTGCNHDADQLKDEISLTQHGVSGASFEAKFKDHRLGAKDYPEAEHHSRDPWPARGILSCYIIRLDSRKESSGSQAIRLCSNLINGKVKL